MDLNIINHTNFVQAESTTVLPDYPYYNVNRTELRDLLDRKFQCNKPFEIMEAVVLAALKNKISPSMNDLITEIMAISTSSAEGNVLSSGFRHINDMLVIKVNKPPVKVPGMTDREFVENLHLTILGTYHEYVVGKCLNELRSIIPNFIYTYAIFQCLSASNVNKGDRYKICIGDINAGHIFIQHLKNQKTLESLAKDLSSVELGKLFLAIFCSLAMANIKMEFCHYDFHAGNVMVRTLDRPITLKYNIGGKDILVNTKYIPTIIDFGVSRIKKNSIVYYRIKQDELIRGHPEMLSGNYPAIDIYKMVSHIISVLVRGNHVTLETAPFFKELINSILHNFTPRDQTRLNMLDANPAAGVAENQRTFFYPVDMPVSNSFASIISFLMKYADSKAVTQPVRCKDDELKNRIFGLDAKGEITHSPCNGESSPNMDQFGRPRSIFDCAKYYFDGTFNIVEFAVGTTIYHGSPALVYYNSEMPLGVEYYSWASNRALTSVDRNVLRSGNHNEKKIILDKVQPINISFYGDLSTASAYSATPVDIAKKRFNCGRNCTNAYKVIKPLILVDMSDPYNIYTMADMLSTELAWLITVYHGQTYFIPSGPLQVNDPVNIKYIYDKIVAGDATMTNWARQGINIWKSKFTDSATDALLPGLGRYMTFTAKHPLRRFIAENLDRNTMRFPDYVLPNKLMKYFEDRKYSGYANLITPRIGAKERFGEIVLGNKVKSLIKRDYTNPYDWQYNDGKYLFGSIGKLLKDFSKYKTTNIDFHAGDLLQHSIWTALYIQWMLKTNHPAARNLGPYKNILIAAGLLHDIGKGGDMVYTYYDKDQHPEMGYQYMNRGEYKTQDGIINLNDVLNDMNMTTFSGLIMFLIRYHWEIGNIIKDCGSCVNKIIDDNCIKRMYDRFKEMCEESKMQNDETTYSLVFASLYLLWSADLMATQPFIAHDKLNAINKKINDLVAAGAPMERLNYYLNEVSEEFPFIINMPKVHRGKNKYDDFCIQDKDLDGIYLDSGRGLSLRNGVLQMIKDSFDADRL